MGPSGLLVFESAAQLREYLSAELGYCTCAAKDALQLLRDVLEFAKLRSEAGEDHESHKGLWRAQEDRLQFDRAAEFSISMLPILQLQV